MKKIIVAIVVFGAIIACGLMYGRLAVREENTWLNMTSLKVYGDYASRAAYKALDLCHPFMYEDDYGSFRGRLEQIPKTRGLLIISADSYEHVILDMDDAMEKKISHDNKNALSQRDLLEELERATPRRKVLEMGDAIQRVGVLTVTDCESVAKAKEKQEELAKLQQKLDELLKS